MSATTTLLMFCRTSPTVPKFSAIQEPSSHGASVRSAFAASNGYSARVGSIDGESLAVTADYRPDRFTLSTVSGAVTSCTYG